MNVKHCDKRFYPYIDKILGRLPEQIRKKEILCDTTLTIISFDGKSTYGQYLPLQFPTSHLIILNEMFLDRPEFEIIHTIAHEIAHKVAGKGRTGLNEMEAENLLVKWGFEKEVEAVDYYRSWMETDGYKIGYKWAEIHKDDLSHFEEYYNEWNEGRLSADRLQDLHYDVDVTSVLHEMGYIEKTEVTSDDVPDDVITDDTYLDRGIMWGIMCFLREKKAEEQRFYTEMGKDEEFEFIQTLKRIDADISKLFRSDKWFDYYNKNPTRAESIIVAATEIEKEILGENE